MPLTPPSRLWRPVRDRSTHPLRLANRSAQSPALVRQALQAASGQKDAQATRASTAAVRTWVAARWCAPARSTEHNPSQPAPNKSQCSGFFFRTARAAAFRTGAGEGRCKTPAFRGSPDITNPRYLPVTNQTHLAKAATTRHARSCVARCRRRATTLRPRRLEEWWGAGGQQRREGGASQQAG